MLDWEECKQAHVCICCTLCVDVICLAVQFIYCWGMGGVSPPHLLPYWIPPVIEQYFSRTTLLYRVVYSGWYPPICWKMKVVTINLLEVNRCGVSDQLSCESGNRNEPYSIIGLTCTYIHMYVSTGMLSSANCC